VDVDVHAGLESALALLAGRAAERGVTLVREYAPALPAVAGYPADLNEAWGALLDNALDAAATPPSGRGRVTVRTAVGDGAVLVAVGDNGPGVPPALVERIWEPFFTTSTGGSSASHRRPAPRGSRRGCRAAPSPRSAPERTRAGSCDERSRARCPDRAFAPRHEPRADHETPNVTEGPCCRVSTRPVGADRI
jgi:hypothetical protein